MKFTFQSKHQNCRELAVMKTICGNEIIYIDGNVVDIKLL